MKKIVAVVSSSQVHSKVVFLIRSGAKIPSDVEVQVLRHPTKQQLRALVDQKGDEVFLIVAEDVRCGPIRVAEHLLQSVLGIATAYVSRSAVSESFVPRSENVILYSQEFPAIDCKERLLTFLDSESSRKSEVRHRVPEARPTGLAAAG